MFSSLPCITPNRLSAKNARSTSHRKRSLISILTAVLLLATIVGCGSGGYAGGGIQSLSASSLTIDAGQSYTISSVASPGESVSWTLAGTSCSGAACGSLSSPTGSAVTFQAPSGLTSTMPVTLTASILGTSNHQSVQITVNPDPTIIGTLPGGTVGLAYSSTLTTAGGTAPMKGFVLTTGSLPPGLSLNMSTGVISGTPTSTGGFSFGISNTDSSIVPYPAMLQASIVVTASSTPAMSLLGTLPAGTVGTAYAGALQAQGGVAPYTYSILSGVLPSGLQMSAAGVITGTPSTQGTSAFVAQAVDAEGNQATAAFSITVKNSASTLALTLSSLPNGTVNVPYSQTIGVSGGTAPYVCSLLSGSLPAGLILNSNCVVAGTPTTVGTSTIQVKVFDSSNPIASVTGPISITITPAALSFTVGTLPNGTVSVPYSSTIGVSGGTSPYSCSIVSGTLPSGLALGANCLVSGTPTLADTSNLVVKATDSSNPVQSVTGPISITITPAALSFTIGTLPNGTVSVPYSSTIGVSGGTSPYSCSIVTGTLPSGLALGANCLVSGTPTLAGTSNLTIRATDSSNPIQSITGPISITITPAALSFTVGTLPNGTVSVPYSSTIGVSGGTSPYSCSIVSGTLPSGLALGANCLVSGTPTLAGTSNLTVKATDSSNPVQSITGPISITITPAALSFTVGTLPNGTVSVPYSSTIGVSGGTSPYSCSIVSGTLPSGLALGANCLVSGTPTLAGTSNLVVKATDSSNPLESVTGAIDITINPAAPTLVISSPPGATVGLPYTGTIGVSGGSAPYTCTITAGTLPAGLTISNCIISGTPTVASTTTLTVQTTDTSKPSATATGPVSLVVSAAPSTLTLTSPPNATVSTPYSGSIGVSGGTGPYTCMITGGTLPTGLTINNCLITGTPATAGNSVITVKATDSSNPVQTITGPVTITVVPIATLTLTGSLPNATLGVAYSQTLNAAGGLAPYTYQVSAGNLPASITLSSSGVISGTPTAVGAYSFSVTATDAEGTPQTATLPLILQVVYPTTPNDVELKGPYAFLFQGYDDVLAGVLAYQTASIGSFTADGTGIVGAGELDANHQSSQPASGLITSNSFLGSYTIGTDHRGLITITTLNSGGTVNTTSTYSIALKAPVSPATNSTQGSLIEFDNDQLQGTKGSGTLLAQDTPSLTAGLNGTYAFGLSGDTPCLPTCTIGVIAGPAASVGEFTSANNIITAGISDATVASTTLANLPLTGTNAVADGNGRVQLTLNTGGTPAGVYPSHYAVYVVSANRVLMMSTDAHSSSILLAGSAQLRSQTTFSSSQSMNGPFVGYENSASNPGLVSGLVLQNVLNLSTATIFRGVGSADGNCTITNINQGGISSLVGGVTGILGSLTGLTGLLGAYSTTGATTCNVAGNGRGVLQYPTQTLLGLPIGTPPAPRVFYLTGPNQGYFLETGYAAVGQFEAQTGAPFTTANTFTGSYVYGTSPASSLASIDSTGEITSNGAGQATSTLDLNVGVGTINVLQLGTTSTQTYTAPDPTTGVFTLNGSIYLYPISPNRFVLLDTNPLTTSPTVSVLY